MSTTISKPSVSVIVTTYNWPKALDRCLAHLCANTQPHEIIVADDGSRADTQAVIESWQAHSPHIQHVWQPDNGFAAAQIRNKAAAVAKGEYFIFIDGDCLVPPNFIQRHQCLAEHNAFVAGNRILLSESYTRSVLEHKRLLPTQIRQWIGLRVKGHCNRWLPVCYWPFNYGRLGKAGQWQGAKTCNLAVWRKDFYVVNGFDEAYTGWGLEDSDLVARLIHADVAHKSGRFAVPVFHCHHTENSREQLAENQKRFNNVLLQKKIKAENGVTQYHSAVQS